MGGLLKVRKAVKNNDKKINIKNIFSLIKIDKKVIMAASFLLITIIVIIIINNYTTFGIVLNKKITNEDTNVIELKGSNNKVFPYNDKILVYNTGKLFCYNKYGKLSFEMDVEDTINAEIQISGDYIQVLNKDKNIVYIYNNKYEIARIKLKENIYSSNINSSGMSIIEYNSSASKRALKIFDEDGYEKYNINLNNGIIGKYILSENSRYLAYVEVDTSGISAFTSVNLIDLKNIKSSEKTYETIFSEDNSLVYDIYFEGNNVVIRTQDKHVIYNISNKKLSETNITNEAYEEIGDYDLKYAYIKLNKEGKYMLCLRKMTNEKEKLIELEESPKYFLYEHGLAYVCYLKKIHIYNGFGTRIKEFESNSIITKPIIFNNGKSVAILISNKIEIFTI